MGFISEFHGETLPNLYKLAALALTAPVHTADCERGFSVQNRIVTPMRNRILSKNFDKLMRILLEGPAVSDYETDGAVFRWRNVKNRMLSTSTKK